MEKKKIGYKDLNGILKTAVIVAWIELVIYVVYFFIGIVEGILLAY